MSKSAFETWFRHRFGQRPHGRVPWRRLREHMLAAIRAASAAQLAVRKREAWDARHDAALTVWQTAQNPKSTKKGR